MAALRLASSAFRHDAELPRKYTADGDDVSPPLEWEGVPDGTKELVLVVDDPDGETGVVTHWIVYGITPDTSSLPEGLRRDAVIEEDGVSVVQGLNEFDVAGWSGPAADDDRGPHRIFFRLFALDTELPLPPGVDRAELRRAAKDHILSTAMLVGIA